MADYFYQIKGKDTTNTDCGFYSSNWAFPPLFSGRVSAKDKKDAKANVEEEYGRKFPQRVLKKDLEAEHYLIKIEEIKPGSHTDRLFDEKTCQCCGNKFSIIERYNSIRLGNYDYCSDECVEKTRELEYVKREENEYLGSDSCPCIYRIKNKQTGMVYVGQTIQPFTLRWWQHIKAKDDCKFHKAMQDSNITDWWFEILEEIEFKLLKTHAECRKHILERERYYIKYHDSIENGYNSL